MREIKFRAFNTRARTMYPPEHFACRADGVWLQLLSEEMCTWRENTGEMVFLQYTGLKDKNGKEIYEGDVIHNNKWKSVNGTGNAEVKWGKLGWDSDYYFLTKGEIIGNIYENPDLLAKK